MRHSAFSMECTDETALQSVNLEAWRSAAIKVCENPEGPQNKLLVMYAASKITSFCLFFS